MTRGDQCRFREERQRDIRHSALVSHHPTGGSRLDPDFMGGRRHRSPGLSQPRPGGQAGSPASAMPFSTSGQLSGLLVARWPMRPSYAGGGRIAWRNRNIATRSPVECHR